VATDVGSATTLTPSDQTIIRRGFDNDIRYAISMNLRANLTMRIRDIGRHELKVGNLRRPLSKLVRLPGMPGLRT
jgi:hypothetical protein